MRLAAMEEILTPSFHGEKCRHNGENADYDIACDERDYFLICFPEWEEEFAKTKKGILACPKQCVRSPFFH